MTFWVPRAADPPVELDALFLALYAMFEADPPPVDHASAGVTGFMFGLAFAHDEPELTRVMQRYFERMTAHVMPLGTDEEAEQNLHQLVAKLIAGATRERSK